MCPHNKTHYVRIATCRDDGVGRFGGRKIFRPNGKNRLGGRVSTDRFRPDGLKKCGRNHWSWQNATWRSLATICRNAYPKTKSGMAQPCHLVATSVIENRLRLGNTKASFAFLSACTIFNDNASLKIGCASEIRKQALHFSQLALSLQ
jgi:hypothetical protein